MARTLPRRRLLAAAAALTVGQALTRSALAAGALDAQSLGVAANSTADQSDAVQAALDQAGAEGRPLLLPGGHVFVHDLKLQAEASIIGQPGSTMLINTAGGPVASAILANNLSLSGIGFSHGFDETSDSAGALLAMDSSRSVRISDCSFVLGRSSGIALESCEATIEDCDFDALGHAAIFSRNSQGLFIRGNRISRCGNGGVLIWRDAPGTDGSIVSQNRISDIDWRGGGNGQNGNGINVFRAGGVIVSDNHIARCAFTAVRLNATDDTQVRGNTCLASGEVAIFSEFGFSGSIVSDNIVDGAAGGISITNFNDGGRLAVVSGNLVRNIAPNSSVNPDTTPFGIAAEADTAVTGNVVEDSPGVGISVGWGPYLRDVLVSGNVVRSCVVGIAASVADGAGTAQISGNLVTGASRAALAGTAWTEIITDDLAADSGRFPHLTVTDNRVA